MPAADRQLPVDSPVILLLAAGEGSRFGGIKQLGEIAGQPMLRRVVQTALATGLPAIAVLGAHAEAVAPVLSDLPVHVLRHAAWHEGMGSSLAIGMRHLVAHFPHASAVMVLLGDQPLVDGEMLDAILAQHAASPGTIVATAQGDQAGPPALFPRDCFDALAHCRGDQGARAVLAAEASRVKLQRAGNPLDVDTRDDLRRILAELARQPR